MESKKWKVKLILSGIGIVLPFAIVAVCTYINVYIRYLPDWIFWRVAIPVMVIGLLPIISFLFSILPQKWPSGLRWFITLVVAGGCAFGLYILLMFFVFWFHFAIDGSC